jgi:hypothetical protein
MSKSQNLNKVFLFKKWVLYHFIGWLLGIIFVLILSSSFDALGITNLQFFVALGIGLGVGISQWLLLKTTLEIEKKWIVVTALGLTTPFLVADLLTYFDILHLKSLLIPVCISIGSLLTGYFQALLLKPYHIKITNWIAITFFSWVLIALAVYSVEYTNLLSKNVWFGFVINLILLLSGGIILGCITGLYLKKNGINYK